METCKNCGTAYDEDLDRCPHCGKENSKEDDGDFLSDLFGGDDDDCDCCCDDD